VQFFFITFLYKFTGHYLVNVKLHVCKESMTFWPAKTCCLFWLVFYVVWEFWENLFLFTPLVFHRNSRFRSKIVYLDRLDAGLNLGSGLQLACVLHTTLRVLDVGSGNKDTRNSRIMP